MAEKAYEPGTKGHRIAVGDEERVFLFDIDDEGNVTHFRSEDEAPEEARLAKRPKAHANKS